MDFEIFPNECRVLDERMEKGREFQIVNAAIWKEWEPKERSVKGTCKLIEEHDYSL